jgi:hypothetical protein
VTRYFVQVIAEFDLTGYLVHAFGQQCVDDSEGPAPDPASVLRARVGYDVDWPPESSQPGWELDAFCDLVEVFHDLVSRPSSRWYHDYSGCGWHYSAFATGPARRLYRWRINRLLVASRLGIRLVT